MSRRTALTITLQIRLPVPPGHKASVMIKEFGEAVKRNPMFKGFENQIVATVVKRETIYL